MRNLYVSDPKLGNAKLEDPVPIIQRVLEHAKLGGGSSSSLMDSVSYCMFLRRTHDFKSGTAPRRDFLAVVDYLELVGRCDRESLSGLNRGGFQYLYHSVLFRYYY
jgi:hypothetical protein